MIVRDAKEAAREWVLEAARRLPGFQGAFFHGSTTWLPDDAPLHAASDVDVMVVLADPVPPEKPGKFLYRGVLLEASYLSEDELRSPEAVLGQYHLAGSFRAPSVILDPSGRLTELQATVSRDFAKRRWVLARCAHARDKVLAGLGRLDASDPFHQQVLTWLFPTGVTTHVLLTAGLQNPTVRNRYAAVRMLLARYGHADLYETLLEVLGCARMSRESAEHHLAALSEVFDAAAGVIRTPVPFASDITDIARPIAIDGSRDLIVSGSHREAVFWLVATWSRCQTVLHHDAPAEVRDRFEPGYRRLLGDLGITSFADLQRRRERVEALLPRVWHVAEEIVAANPEIRD